MSTVPPVSVPRAGVLRRGAVALVLGASVLAGCQTVDEKPEPIRDLRGAEPRRDAPSSLSPPSSGAVSGGESEQRRRASIRLELATGYYQQGNYAQALEELRAAVATDPSFAPAYGLYGLVYMDMKDLPRAEENFQRALRLTPDDSDLLNNYGWFLCQSGRPRESIAQFQAALRNPLYATPARPMHNAGICSMRAGDERAAEGWFDQSFRVDPRNPVAMYNLAEIYLKRGDIERARFHSQRLLSSYPPSAETLWLGIRVDRRAGDRDSVASLSAQLRRQFPSSREANLLQRGAFGD
ncbi:MAG: type IV pilus biogenesis/stability protein PilW [Burkholderiales bacterium]|jgi:type IV pilus assembly protein PilF